MNKIILLIRNAAKTDFGGAETYQISLSKVLKESNFTPIIITRSEKLLYQANQFQIQNVKGWWWPRQNWNGKNALLLPIYIAWQMILVIWYTHLIFKLKPQALHIQSKDDFIAATIAGKLTHTTTVWTDHMDLRYIFKNIKKPLRNLLGKLVYCSALLANHIIIISDNEYKLVTSEMKKLSKIDRKIRIIKNGVIDEKEKYGKSPQSDKFIFCLASRITIGKGIGEAIEAFLELEKEIEPNKVELRIYGDGANIKEFKEWALSSKNINFYGHKKDAKRFINKADVFILPSYQEGFSIALLEASMLGKAIIASDVDSNSEIISSNHNGILVPAKNSKQLEVVMLRLYNDRKAVKTLGENARRIYTRNFNLERIVKEKIVILYNQLPKV